MRRQEKELTDPAAIDEVLDGAEWGVLGLASPEGTPVLVPLNFVHFEGRIYFHGSPSGQKMDLIRANEDTPCQAVDATFLVVDAYAQIPSYAFDPARACPATQYFKSVILYGRLGVVEDLDRKAQVLSALMEKLQPEGGYTPITASDPLYQASVKGVAILEMTVTRRSGKFETGQRLTPEKRASVVDLLEKRGCPVDLRTLSAMGQPEA